MARMFELSSDAGDQSNSEDGTWTLSPSFESGLRPLASVLMPKTKSFMDVVRVLRLQLYAECKLNEVSEDLPPVLYKPALKNVMARLRQAAAMYGKSTTVDSSVLVSMEHRDEVVVLANLDKRRLTYYAAAAKLSRRCFGKLEAIDKKLVEGKLGNFSGVAGVSPYIISNIVVSDEEAVVDKGLSLALSNEHHVRVIKTLLLNRHSHPLDSDVSVDTEQLNKKFIELQEELQALRVENREFRLTICKLNAEVASKSSEIWKLKADLETAKREAELVRLAMEEMTAAYESSVQKWLQMYESELIRSSALEAKLHEQNAEPQTRWQRKRTSESAVESVCEKKRSLDPMASMEKMLAHVRASYPKVDDQQKNRAAMVEETLPSEQCAFIIKEEDCG